MVMIGNEFDNVDYKAAGIFHTLTFQNSAVEIEVWTRASQKEKSP